MNKKNNFLSKGVLFLLLSFLIGCSSTVKKQVDPLVQLTSTSTFPSTYAYISTTNPTPNFTKLDVKDATFEQLVLINELENTSVFLEGYFKSLKELISTEKVTDTKTRVLLYEPSTSPTYQNTQISSLSEGYLNKVIPIILASKVNDNIKENKQNILNVLYYREYLIKTLDNLYIESNNKNKPNDKNESIYKKSDHKNKIVLNNLFIKNRGLMYLWGEAINKTKKEIDENYEVNYKNISKNSDDYLKLIKDPLVNIGVVSEGVETKK